MDVLIAKYPPKFSAFKRDFLFFVIDRILMRSQFIKDTVYFDYVPLSSTKLQHVKKNYKDHIDYLLEIKVIQCDNRFIVGEKSKGYRLNPDLGHEIKIVTVMDFVIKRKVKELKAQHRKSLEGLGHLTKWFNDGLSIDMSLVTEYANRKFEYLKNRKYLWEHKRAKGKSYNLLKHPAKQYQQTLISAQRLESNDYYVQRDNTSKRLHHNLSNMPSAIRNAIQYNGDILVSIDIKNSQPYLGLCLLNPHFWTAKNEPEIDIKTSSINPEAQDPSNINISLKISEITDYLADSKYKLHYTMLGETVKPLVNKDFYSYIQSVTSGRHYEILKETFLFKYGKEMTRAEVKDIVFLIMFGGNKGGSPDDIEKRKLFKSLYPDVFNVFSTIKKFQKELLAILLQSIESYLILEVITKHIAERYPDAPLFTIHDSIATTPKYAEFVREIMCRILTDNVGYAPSLSVEKWERSHIVKCIEEINLKSENARKGNNLYSSLVEEVGLIAKAS